MRLLVSLLCLFLISALLLAGETAKPRPYFLIGSSKQAVVNLLGKPISYQPLLNWPNSGVLFYDNGSVEVDQNAVVNWEHLNFGRTGITGEHNAFSRLASPNEVVSVVGLPPSAKRLTPADSAGNGETEIWNYPNASLLFKDKALIGWRNFSHALPIRLLATNAHAPQLGGSSADISAAKGAPEALIPSAAGTSTLWIYPDNAFFLQGDVIYDRATPRLQAYLSTHDKTPEAQDRVAQWLVLQPYLDYHTPVPSDKQLLAAFVKQNGATLRAQANGNATLTPVTSATTTTGPNTARGTAAAQKRARNNLQQAQNTAYQKLLQASFQQYLKANFVQIPKILKTTTVKAMTAKLEKLGLKVEVLPQKLGAPAGALYAAFPMPGYHVRPKTTVTLYVTQ
jgi:hypothetical protein